MVERMGGTVKRDEKSDYIIAPKSIEIEGSAIVVQACWINALFGAKSYMDPKKFTFQKIERVFPATHSEPLKNSIVPLQAVAVSVTS